MKEVRYLLSLFSWPAILIAGLVLVDRFNPQSLEYHQQSEYHQQREYNQQSGSVSSSSEHPSESISSSNVFFAVGGNGSLTDSVTPSIYSPDLNYGMDTSISPCDDFYEYVNGGWRKEVKFPEGTPYNRMFWNNFFDSPIRTYSKLKEIMGEVHKTYETSSDPIVRLVGTFYNSCLVSDSLETSIALRLRNRKKDVKDSTREDMCISRTRKYLGGAVGEMFAHKLDEVKSMEKMRMMLASIKAEVVNLVSAHTLMTEEDRKNTIARLEKLYLRVGIPDKLTDYSGLNLSADNYFENKNIIANFNTVRSANRIGTDMRELWKMGSFTANAFYSPSEHAIEVPPAMFIPPFFEPERDEALSYAASGVIIGHEIFHSLAAQLATSENPLMVAEIDSFKAMNSRLGTVDGWSTDGNRTYNEDIADLGGVKASYGAWKKKMEKDTKMKAMKIDGFTPDQRFFIAYGRLWRGKWAVESAPNGNVHAAFFARINGMVRQMPEFAEAFGCKEGDKMVLPKSQLSKLW